MRQINLLVDENAAGTLDQLKLAFGVTTDAAVLQRALALARVAAENASADHTVTIVGDQNKSQTVQLSE